MEEHKIITKLRRPLENFTVYDLAELIQAYDEVRAECNRVKEDVALALRQPYVKNTRQEWDCEKCEKINYGAASCDCMVADDLDKEIVQAAVKWWHSQEGSDTEFHEAVQELSAVVGKYAME